MQNELNIREEFSKFLKTQKHYSTDDLVFEFVIEKMRIDLLIHNKSIKNNSVDLKSNPYLALVEFKADGNNLDSATKQIKSYLEALNYPKLPCFLVIPSNNANEVFDVFLLTTYGLQQISKEHFPDITTLSNNLI